MITLLEILKKTTTWFETKGIPNPRLDAELLLAHSLKLDRMQIYLQFDRPMYDQDLEALRPLVQRRGKREPLQHIIGTTGFRHLEVKCTKDALIPRPETETLVDLGLNFLQKLASQKHKNRESADRKTCLKDSIKVVDVGTGTGAIILSLALELPELLRKQNLGMDLSTSYSAIDISPAALVLAQENAELNQVEGVEWIAGDSFINVKETEIFDLIISNPPYIPKKEIQDLEPEVREFDPQLALVGGENGLEIPKRILMDSLKHIRAGSVLIFELGPSQVDELQFWLEPQKSDIPHIFEKFEDLNGLERFAQITFS